MYGLLKSKFISLYDRLNFWLGYPMISFHLILIITFLLTSLGLIIVLSSSSVYSYNIFGSPWLVFRHQVLWTVVGLIAFCLSLRIPIVTLHKLALPVVLFTIFLLILVIIPGVGKLSNGSRSWFVIAGISIQPSELTKISFAVWGAHLLTNKCISYTSLYSILTPLLTIATIILILVFSQPDLGQAVSIAIVLVGLFWYARLPIKLFIYSILSGITVVFILAISSGYRSERIQSWLDPSVDNQGIGYQSHQAKLALANGCIFGNGLGQGAAKWGYLPNAHNDFIFAIFGEELGFIGSLLLLVLFTILTYTGMYVAQQLIDPFLRLLTSTIILWVIGQTIINISYVIGLLPVTGLQLPFISVGGSSQIVTFLMIGLVMNASRHTPQTIALLWSGHFEIVGQALLLPLPKPFKGYLTNEYNIFDINYVLHKKYSNNFLNSFI